MGSVAQVQLEHLGPRVLLRQVDVDPLLEPGAGVRMVNLANYNCPEDLLTGFSCAMTLLSFIQ